MNPLVVMSPSRPIWEHLTAVSSNKPLPFKLSRRSAASVSNSTATRNSRRGQTRDRRSGRSDNTHCKARDRRHLRVPCSGFSSTARSGRRQRESASAPPHPAHAGLVSSAVRHERHRSRGRCQPRSQELGSQELES